MKPVSDNEPKPSPINYHALLKRCCDNTEFVETLLNKFCTQLENAFVEVPAKMDSESCTEIAEEAHRLKGTSATMAVESIRQAAANLESSARAADPELICHELEKLRAEIGRFLEWRAQ